MRNSQKVMIDEIKARVALPDWWTREGFQIKATAAGRMASRCCPAADCGEAPRRKDAVSLMLDSANVWRWKCFRCGSAGTVIDAELARRGGTAHQAAMRLRDAFGVNVADAIVAAVRPTAAERSKRDAERRKAIKKAVDAVRSATFFDPKVRQYLKGRGLSDSTIDAARQRGILVGLNAHPGACATWWRFRLTDEEMILAGMMRAGSKCPAAAFRPLAFVSSGGDAVEFRNIGAGNGAKAGQVGVGATPFVWHTSSQKGARRIYVVEGGIDALSLIDLGMVDADTAVIGIFGTGAWRPEWMVEFAKANPGAEWHIALDADEAGDNAARSIIEVVSQSGVRVSRLRPWAGVKDWNDVLVSARAMLDESVRKVA